MVQGVVQVLASVFAHHKPADKAIESLFRRNKRWGKRDRAFVAERSYDLVRWWNRIERLSGDDGNVRDPRVLLRRWAAYEIWPYCIKKYPITVPHLFICDVRQGSWGGDWPGFRGNYQAVG